jgi:hypothetical protein
MNAKNAEPPAADSRGRSLGEELRPAGRARARHDRAHRVGRREQEHDQRRRKTDAEHRQR